MREREKVIERERERERAQEMSAQTHKHGPMYIFHQSDLIHSYCMKCMHWPYALKIGEGVTHSGGKMHKALSLCNQSMSGVGVNASVPPESSCPIR